MPSTSLHSLSLLSLIMSPKPPAQNTATQRSADSALTQPRVAGAARPAAAPAAAPAAPPYYSTNSAPPAENSAPRSRSPVVALVRRPGETSNHKPSREGKQRDTGASAGVRERYWGFRGHRVGWAPIGRRSVGRARERPVGRRVRSVDRRGDGYESTSGRKGERRWRTRCGGMRLSGQS